jgi:hypothetical protein
MPTRRELCVAEEAGWAAFCRGLDAFDRQAAEAPGYSPDWSVKDLMAHVGNWLAETCQIFERIRMGTHRPEPLDVDAMNREFFEANRDLPLGAVRAELVASRNRFLQEFDAIPEGTPLADEWFVESGPEHYAEHLARLLGWASEVRA